MCSLSDASSEAFGPYYALGDFEEDVYILDSENWEGFAKAKGRLDDVDPIKGQTSYRIDYEFPRHSRPVNLGPIDIPRDVVPDEAWGIEVWVKATNPRGVHLTMVLQDQNEEQWEYNIPLAKGPNVKASDGAGDDEWMRFLIPFDWMNLITWLRYDGVLDRSGLSSMSFRLSARRSASDSEGSLWLDGIRFITAEKRVGSREVDDFTLLELGDVFNSDGVASRQNPRDGDFHTGEWEPFTLPAEWFPKGPTVKFKGAPFEMPAIEDGVDNHLRSNGQKLTGFPTGEYSAAYFIGAGKFGPQLGNVVLHYEDGGRELALLDISDWCTGPTRGDVAAYRFPYCFHWDRQVDRKPYLYLQSIRIDPKRRLAAIELPSNDYLKIFAMTLSRSPEPPEIAAMQSKRVAEVHPEFRMAGLDEIDFDEPAKPVGVLGGYVMRRHGNYTVDIPTANGYLTFAANADTIGFKPPLHRLYWEHFEQHRRRELGGLMPMQKTAGIVKTELLDSTAIKYSIDLAPTGVGRVFSVLHSRAFPAALYYTDTIKAAWWSPNVEAKGWVALMGKDGVETHPLRTDEELPTPQEPWLLVWHTENKWGDAVPMLLVLENKPKRIGVAELDAETKIEDVVLELEYSKTAGHIAAMPLMGISRLDGSEAQSWTENGPSEEIVEACRAWMSRLQAFPVGVKETADIDEESKRVEIGNAFTYLELNSEWDVPSQRIAPLPPVAAIAADKGYDVELPDGLVDAKCDSFWGPFLYVDGEVINYSIPLPRYVDSMLTPSKSSGDEITDEVLSFLQEDLNDRIPSDLDGYRYQSDNSGLLNGLRTLAPSRLLVGDSDALRDFCRGAVESSLLDKNLKVEKEPLTGQFYLMDDGFWAKDANYDKEWAIGFMLQGLWNYSYYFDDPDFLSDNWGRIKGLYKYYQVIFDWTTSSTYTMPIGGGFNSDGARIAWEGMLAMARMADEIGDHEMYKDAAVRSARQAMGLYASWFGPDWAVEHDYVTSLNRRIDVEDAETRFSPDHLWTETTTCNTANTPDFFQVTHAFYIFNLAHLMFLHDTGLDELKLRPWIYEVVPELHPDWANGNKLCKGSQRYYGNDHSMAHLIARALLFHEDPATLLDFYRSSADDTIVIDRWYTPKSYTATVLTALSTGRAPLVIAPTSYFSVSSNEFDVVRSIQEIDMTGKRDGACGLTIRCWNMPILSVEVNGESVPHRYDNESDYLTIDLQAKDNERQNIVIKYSAPPKDQE